MHSLWYREGTFHHTEVEMSLSTLSPSVTRFPLLTSILRRDFVLMASQRSRQTHYLGMDSDVTKPRFFIVHLKTTTDTGLSESLMCNSSEKNKLTPEFQSLLCYNFSTAWQDETSE